MKYLHRLSGILNCGGKVIHATEHLSTRERKISIPAGLWLPSFSGWQSESCAGSVYVLLVGWHKWYPWAALYGMGIGGNLGCPNNGWRDCLGNFLRKWGSGLIVVTTVALGVIGCQGAAARPAPLETAVVEAPLTETPREAATVEAPPTETPQGASAAPGAE